jgi:hypothetical protein
LINLKIFEKKGKKKPFNLAPSLYQARLRAFLLLVFALLSIPAA